MINLLKSLHLLTLFYISDALFKRQNSLAIAYTESRQYFVLYNMQIKTRKQCVPISGFFSRGRHEKMVQDIGERADLRSGDDHGGVVRR